MITFMEYLSPYKGTTFSEIDDGCQLTYEERLEIGKNELGELLSEYSEDELRNHIIENADFEYDNIYRYYRLMIVLTVEKETGNIIWWLRED